MTLFIDGDAFPNLLKPIVLKTIERLQIKTYVIANKKINVGQSLSKPFQRTFKKFSDSHLWSINRPYTQSPKYRD